MDHRSIPELERVSPSMIRSVFTELKANGYTDGQILALSAGLAKLVSGGDASWDPSGLVDELTTASDRLDQEGGLSNLGYSEEYEALCAAGIPQKP